MYNTFCMLVKDFFFEYLKCKIIFQQLCYLFNIYFTFCAIKRCVEDFNYYSYCREELCNDNIPKFKKSVPTVQTVQSGQIAYLTCHIHCVQNRLVSYWSLEYSYHDSIKVNL